MDYVNFHSQTCILNELRVFGASSNFICNSRPGFAQRYHSKFYYQLHIATKVMAAVPKGKRIIKAAKRNKLLLAIIAGAVLGFILGAALNPTVQSMKQPNRTNTVNLIGFLGELFLRSLKLIILPLIVSSLIVGLATLDPQTSGKLGLRALTYYLTTTVAAVILGIILVSAIQPGGDVSNSNHKKQEKRLVSPLDSFLDILRSVIPENIIAAAVIQGKTTIIEAVEKRNETLPPKIQNVLVSTPSSQNASILNATTVLPGVQYSSNQNQSFRTVSRRYKLPSEYVYTHQANFLGIISFTIVFGIVLGTMPEKAMPLVAIVNVVNLVIMKLVSIAMLCAPVGICSLVAARLCEMPDMSETFISLALFIVTVCLGIGIHTAIVLPIGYFLIVRRNPYKFMQGLADAMVTAFGTDSSAATLPVTFRCLETNNGVDKRVTQFVLPVGATINMDGTALYEAVAAIFIAQATGRTLSFGDYISISLTSTLASIGAASVPHAGLVTMLIVLETVGLPTDMIGLIYAVDWFLDRLRTMANVMGDSLGAGIVHHLSKKDLQAIDIAQEMNETDRMV